MNFNKFVDLSYVLLQDLNDDTASRHWTFLLRKNRIVSIGRNRAYHSHPICKRLGYRFETLHSEADCILKVYRDIPNMGPLKMINVRLSTQSLERKQPVLRMSKPCIGCMKLLSGLPQIKKVYYSTDHGFEQL